MRLEQTAATIQATIITQKTSLRHEVPFADSCLPRLMSIALQSRDLLFPLLRAYPDAWSFIDKIFVMLAPVFQLVVEAYYANKGRSMMETYRRSQIERFDRLLAHHLLEKLEGVRLEGNSI